MDADYKVKLEVFEGPLDLLLYLIKQDEIDIYDVSLERIWLDSNIHLRSLRVQIGGEARRGRRIATDLLPASERARPSHPAGTRGACPV